MEKCLVAMVSNAFEMATTTGIRLKGKNIYTYMYRSELAK